MPTLIKAQLDKNTLPEVERLELERILDLHNANRFPTEVDIEFLKARARYLDSVQLHRHNVSLPVDPEEERLDEEIASDPESMTVAELKAYAKKEEIDLKGKTLKKAIIRVIKRAINKKALKKKK